MPGIRFVATSDEVRALDRSLEADLGLRSVELMEIAGAGCFLLLRPQAEAASRVVVVAGPGQNGGDGFVVARYAAAALIPTSVFAMKEPAAATSSRAQFERLKPFDSVDVAIGDLGALEAALAQKGTLVIDAIFGTGIKHPLRSDAIPWITAVNQARGVVISIDLPSGIDGDTGLSDPVSVKASRTLTIGAVKPGLLAPPGARQAGEIAVVPLPYPPHRVQGLRRIAPD